MDFIEYSRLIYEAKRVVASARNSKRLHLKPCVICGQTKVEAHHFDYRNPWRIVWLCRAHHRMQHTKYKGKEQHLGQLHLLLPSGVEVNHPWVEIPKPFKINRYKKVKVT